jgi:hypothetical protein
MTLEGIKERRENENANEISAGDVRNISDLKVLHWGSHAPPLDEIKPDSTPCERL